MTQTDLVRASHSSIHLSPSQPLRHQRVLTTYKTAPSRFSLLSILLIFLYASSTASAQPIQGSLVTVLEQALKSNDNDQSSWVMQ